MYVVVSEWEVLPGREGLFETRGRAVREFLRSQPGVHAVDAFHDEDGKVIAIIAYQDESTYRKLIEDPLGPFAKAVSEQRLEECARWNWSRRGEVMA